MNERIPLDFVPEALEAQRALERYLVTSSLPKGLIELVKLRVSMVNGCAYCIDMHWTALRKSGESEVRLYALGAWREQSGYSARERAALAWAEVVTEVARSHVDDAAYDAVSAQFSQREIADLTFVVVAINGWNRLCVAFRTPPARSPAG